MHKVFHSPAQLYSGVQHRRHDAIAALHMPFREHGVTASEMLPAWYINPSETFVNIRCEITA